MSDKYHKVIGIDLGTTYSAVAVFNRYDEETEIIPNPQSIDHQNRPRLETTPSVVAREPKSGKAYVGWPAKLNLSDPINRIIEIKREMGDYFTEQTLEKFHAKTVFRPREEGAGGYEGDPVKVQFCSEWYLPQEISALTLMKMKEVAEAHIGETIHDAVITVPAYFNEQQKKATKEAAEMAGLYARQLIPEPTAAAICYGVDRMESKEQIYLVYDLGGGTFDVSIIRVEGFDINVLATSGDPRLGGGDFDDEIVKWMLEQLKTQHNLDLTVDPGKVARLKAHAEQMKKELSTLNTVSAGLIDISPEAPSLELTRAEFEKMIEHLLNKSLTYVDKALNLAQDKHSLKRKKLNGILLVGGSTKIPRIKELLLEHFQEDESFVSTGLNPDEVVARGAATVALKFAPVTWEFDLANRPDKGLKNKDADEIPNMELITEHSLGVGVTGNLVSRIIEQGTYIPASRKERYQNAGPTDKIDVEVYQGEGQHTYENARIGTLKIGPMEPKPEGHHQFEVTFSLDEDGILSLTVNHITENKVYQKVLEQKTGVGSIDALQARRNKLLAIYSSGPSIEELKDQPRTQIASDALPDVPTGPVLPPTAAAPVSAPVAEAVAASPVAESQQPSPASVVESPASQSAIAEPDQPVPAEFKSIVRRVNKLLLDRADDAPEPLVAAFNNFVGLLNNGADSDELEEAGDELEDMYHDCR